MNTRRNLPRNRARAAGFRRLVTLALASVLSGLPGASTEAGEGRAPEKRVLWAGAPVVIPEGTRNAAGVWEQSVFPLGNGRLGCTVFGEPQRDRIQFNEDSLWVGNEDCTGGYQPFGDVFVEMPHASHSDYRRELDISRAVQTITYKSGGVGYKREYFASHPAQVLVFHFSADQPAALGGKVTILLAADTNYQNRRDGGWRGEPPHPRVTAQIAAAAKRSYADLLAEHVADYQRLYGRLTLTLGETPAAIAALPTAQRVKTYSEQVKQKNVVAVDRDLEALLYQYARYLMISCSRPGEGRLAECRLRNVSSTTGKAAVRYGPGTARVTLSAGQARRLRPEDFQ